MPIHRKLMETLKKLILSLKKLLTLNIGTLVFGALFIYMSITVLLYITADHVTPYQVTTGPLTKNQTYSALILRSEQIIDTDSPGYVTYYAREGTKVRKTGNVYAIGDTKENQNKVDLNTDDLAMLRSQMAKFSNNFNTNTFYNTYSFKYELKGSILQLGSTAMTPTEDKTKKEYDDAKEDIIIPASLGSQTIYPAPYDGIVLYSTDGYEDLTLDTVTDEDFNQMSYQKKNLISDEKKKVGDPVYKIVTDENWSIMIPLTEKEAAVLAGRTSIRVKFLKDGASLVGKFALVEKDHKKYGQVLFENGMIRYATERFTEIELVTNNQVELKIPMSSIVHKEFYVIPESYKAQGDNKSEVGFLVETTKKNKQKSTEFVNTTLYEKKDGFYYVEKSDFKEGDIIVKADSTERYTIGPTKSLDGTYSMNKGYAVFRKISIIAQNEEYCIVDKNTPYGIAQFDHIVLNAKSVKEEDILY